MDGMLTQVNVMFYLSNPQYTCTSLSKLIHMTELNEALFFKTVS